MTLPKSAVSKQITFAGGLARAGRAAGFFLTAGFMYPNVMVEGIDFAALNAKNKAAAEKL